LVYRLEEMKSNSTLNFGLALLCLCYCAVNMVLMAVNYMNVQMANDDGINGEPVVSDLTYHLTEFWATFGFACVECISLVHTPKSFFKIYNHPLLLKLILFFNIAATLVPAILVTLNLHVFEIASHEIEYVNEMTMAFVEIVMLKSLLRFETSAASLVGQWVVAGLALAVACLQLGVYNLLGRSDDGDMQGKSRPTILNLLLRYCPVSLPFGSAWITRMWPMKRLDRSCTVSTVIAPFAVPSRLSLSKCTLTTI
jgi:hypothetical protein